MCRHMYDWNIVNCDVKQPVQLNSIRMNQVKLPKKEKFVLPREIVAITVIVNSEVLHVQNDFSLHVFLFLAKNLRCLISGLEFRSLSHMVLLSRCVVMFWNGLSW